MSRLRVIWLCFLLRSCSFFFFFFNDPAPTEISPLSLPAALPISSARWGDRVERTSRRSPHTRPAAAASRWRSEEHTSELQSHSDLVCRLLLEKKKQNRRIQVPCHAHTRHGAYSKSDTRVDQSS